MIVVADAAPINVLVQIGLVEPLTVLYGTVFIPTAVLDELSRESTPVPVREWLASKPAWLEVKAPVEKDHGPRAGRGERQAIALAKELKADRLLMDDEKARRKAQQEGITPIGTLGLLLAFSARGLCNLDIALNSLPADFRVSPALIQAVREQGRRFNK